MNPSQYVASTRQYLAHTPNPLIQQAPRFTSLTHRFTSLTHQDVVGISVDARGWPLTLRLLRPASLLGLIYVYRFGYSLGVLQAQIEDERMSDMQRQHGAMRAQRGVLGCLRRVLILQAPALLTTACVAAALADQGAIGLCLIASVAVAILVASSRRGAAWATAPALLCQRGLRVAVAGAVACIALSWLMLQYGLQVAWLRSMLGTRALGWLAWAGLQLPPLPVDVATLERGLRCKTGMLVAVTLLTAAAGCGAADMVSFFPPSQPLIFGGVCLIVCLLCTIAATCAAACAVMCHCQSRHCCCDSALDSQR